MRRKRLTHLIGYLVVFVKFEIQFFIFPNGSFCSRGVPTKTNGWSKVGGKVYPYEIMLVTLEVGANLAASLFQDANHPVYR